MSLCHLVSLKGLNYRIIHQFTLVGRTGSVLIHEDRGSSVPCKTPVEHPEAPHMCRTFELDNHLGDANCEAQSNRDTGREVRVVWKSDSDNPLLPPKLKAWLTRLPLLHTWPVGILEKELANGLLSLSIHVVFMCIFSAYSYLYRLQTYRI